MTNLYSSALFVTAVFVPLMMLVERMTKIGIGNVLGGIGAFLALMWAWSMTIVDGDTFTVLVGGAGYPVLVSNARGLCHDRIRHNLRGGRFGRGLYFRCHVYR